MFTDIYSISLWSLLDSPAPVTLLFFHSSKENGSHVRGMSNSIAIHIIASKHSHMFRSLHISVISANHVARWTIDGFSCDHALGATRSNMLHTLSPFPPASLRYPALIQMWKHIQEQQSITRYLYRASARYKLNWIK